jgi:TonB family protein
MPVSRDCFAEDFSSVSRCGTISREGLGMIRLLVVAVAAINTLLAADLSGRWTGTMETNGRGVPIYLTLKQNDDGPSGSVVTGNDTRQVPIQNAELRGDELAFEVRDNADRLVTFRLKLSDMKMSGEASVQGQISKVSLSLPGRGGGQAIKGGFIQSAQGQGVFRVGGGVSAPTLLYKEEPDYTEEARAAKLQGTVVLYVEINPTGTATNKKVRRGLGLGLDEKAVEAVEKWKFKPGEKDGTPVTVAATIEVNFRL